MYINITIMTVLCLTAGPAGWSFAQGAPSRAEDRAVWRSEHVCGLNCLFLLLRCTGESPDYLAMQETLLEEGRLTSLYDLNTAAARYGVGLRLAKLTPDDLRALPKPVIAHLDRVTPSGESAGHFVVVTRADRDKVRYVDGTTAEAREVPWREFRRAWSGFAAFRSGRGALSWNDHVAAFIVGLAGGWGVELLSRRRRPSLAARPA